MQILHRITYSKLLMFQICLVVAIFILDHPKQENCLCLNSLGNITLKHLDIQQVSQQNSNCFYLAITQFFDHGNNVYSVRSNSVSGYLDLVFLDFHKERSHCETNSTSNHILWIVSARGWLNHAENSCMHRL